ncbi:MAG: tetratricopeptide repeat protein, partial [Flammeovirgaceae bacterium]
SKGDTTQVQRYILMGQQVEASQPDSALRWYEKALTLSRSLGYVKGEISYYTNATFVYNMQGKYDTSLQLNLKSVELARKANNLERLAACLGNVGSSYQYLENYEKAIEYTLLAVELAEKQNDTRKLSVAYGNLGNVYRILRQYPLAKDYAEKALALARETGNPYQICAALLSLGTIKSFTQQFNESIAHLTEAQEISRKLNDQYSLMGSLLNLGNAHLLSGNYPPLEKIYRESLILARTLGDPEGVILSYRGLASYFLFTKDLKKAREFSELSLQQSLSHQYIRNTGEAYLLLSKVALLEGKYKEAQVFQFKTDSIQEVIFDQEKTKNIERLEVQFRMREKEEALIREQQASDLKSVTIRKNQLWILVLVVALAAMAITAWLLMRAANARKKVIEKENELNHIKIHQLESEKQLMASQAVIKGQEQERGRLAKDLHDGLGGMLSGIKFSLANMKSNVVLDADNALQFERSLDMLDQSISELRRVAHNMMPEVLVKFGLDEALRSYCDALNQANIFKLSYQRVGEPRRFDSNTEIIAYRIVQELLNNTVKHAKASQVLVQFAITASDLSITVEDNGVGFDTQSLNESRGAGWANIRSRVNFLNGKLDVQSSSGNGTSVHITLPVS